jgi:hypothetical protein
MYRASAFVILGAAIAALSLILCFLKFYPTGQDLSSALIIRDGDPTDIVYLGIQNSHGFFEIRSSGEGYEVHDIPAPLVDYSRFVKLMTDCASLRAKKIAVENPRLGMGNSKGSEIIVDSDSLDALDALDALDTLDALGDLNDLDDQDALDVLDAFDDLDDLNALAVFGLDNPVSTVHVQYKSGPDMTLNIGCVEPISENVYFMVMGKNPIYLMDAATAANFTCAPKDYVSRRVTDDPGLASPLGSITSVSFAGGGLDRPVNIVSVMNGGEGLRRKALSYGAASHLVNVGDDTFKLDETYGYEILGALMNIKAVDIEAYNCSDAQLEYMGFYAPWMTVDISVANGVGVGNAPGQMALLPEKPVELRRYSRDSQRADF